MTNRRLLLLTTLVVLLTFVLFSFRIPKKISGQNILSYSVDIKSSDLKFYWRNDSSKPFKSIQNLKLWLGKKNKTLLFAMNGGMYKEDNSPLGLFIEEGKTLTPLNTRTGD